MSDGARITARDWETLRACVLHERNTARRMERQSTLSPEEYWAGYAAACDTIHNAMRRVDRRESPAPIEDILTE